jgi:hypothetical protein
MAPLKITYLIRCSRSLLKMLQICHILLHVTLMLLHFFFWHPRLHSKNLMGKLTEVQLNKLRKLRSVRHVSILYSLSWTPSIMIAFNIYSLPISILPLHLTSTLCPSPFCHSLVTYAAEKKVLHYDALLEDLQVPPFRQICYLFCLFTPLTARFNEK